jgi:hypothetical protein
MAAQESPVDGPRLFDGAILRYNCAHYYAPTSRSSRIRSGRSG